MSLLASVKIVLIAMAVLLCSAEARAQVWNLYSPCEEAGVDPGALSGRWRDDACEPSKLDELHEPFAAPPIADLAGAGGQAVRVTITNGYDREIVVAEVVRRAGEAQPRAIARGRGDGDRWPPGFMQADLDEDAWDALARRADSLANAPALLPDRNYAGASRSEEDDEPILLCIHGWSLTVETAGFGQPRVLARNSCDFEDENEDEVWDLGWRTMQVALAALDGCAGIDPAFHRNDAERLSFCLLLSGDVAVAASASNAIMPFLFDEFANPRLRYLLADDFMLTLREERAIVGAEAGFARWREYIATGAFDLYFNAAVGAARSGQSADIELHLVDDAASTWRETRYAEVRQRWRRDGDFWVMEAMSVGAWQTLVYPEEDD
jgi:hypothetical protein